MSDYIVSVDAGNGGTNAVLIKRAAKSYRSHYLPSVRAAATGDSLGLGSQFELDYQYVDWYGHRYVVGDTVTKVTRQRLERHMGADRYGNEFHKFLVAVALANLGVKAGSVDLTLFAPPGMYNALNEDLTKAFSEGGGKVTIRLKGDKQPRTWQYDNVSIWPEGIGAAACFMLDSRGMRVKTEILDGNVVILDIGAYTLDSLLLGDGEFNPESLSHATHENAGLDVHIRQPILRGLHSISEDFTVLTVDDVDQTLRSGLNGGDYLVKIAGKQADLQNTLDRHSKRYAEWIANSICDGMYNGFRGIRGVILVGGGSLLVSKYLRDWYGDKIIDPTTHKTTRKICAVDFNAVGGLRLALMRLSNV